MNAANLTPFDWMLVALLIGSTIRAILRGFLLEACSFAGLLAGILLASWYYPPLAMQLVVWLKPITSIALATANIIAYLLILCLVMVLGSLLGKLLRSSASAIGLGLFDRLLGGAFGLARGCLLGVAGMMALTAFAPASGLLQKSQLFPYFLAGARGVSFVVPGTLQQQLTDGAERIKHSKPVWIKPPQ